MPITNLIRDNWCRFQGELFPEIQDAVGPLLKNHQRFVMALGIICPEDFTLRTSQRDGRPLCDRINLVRAFIAKAICDIPTTRDLVERLKVDRQMRNLCGWVLIHEIPSESTFSRAFAEFAESDLPGRMHEALVKEFIGDSIVGHVSRDSTAIPAREKPTPKCKSDQKPMKRKRGRPRKGEERPPKDKTRLERQAAGDMTLEQMLDDLSKDCDRGAKVNAQGYRNAWVGYKFHIDAIDSGMPVVCILTSASVHDSQVVNRHSTVTHYQRPTVTQLQEGGTGGEVSEILFFSAKSKRRPSLIYSMQIIPVCLSIVARRKGVSATRRGGLNWTPISLLVGHPCKLFHKPGRNPVG